MAFFGLTALGPQNCFEYASRSATHLFIFEDKDFEASWRKILGKSLSATNADLTLVFKTLYHGPVPQTDKEVIADAFSHLQEPYRFDDYMNSLRDLRDRLESNLHKIRDGPGPSCNFKESTLLQHAIRNNKIPDRSLHEKQCAPLTSAQEVNITVNLSNVFLFS